MEIKERPIVSIILPIYNVQKYLSRCMDSLLNQSLRNIEIILVNDGSPDGCPQMCDEYAKLDNRVKVIHKKNEGLGYARNSGLELATGCFVVFIDSDDYVSLNMLENLYKVALNNGSDIVFCGLRKEVFKGQFIDVHGCSELLTIDNNDDIKSVALDFVASAPFVKTERKHSMAVWHAIYKRDLICDNNLRFLSERHVGSEDLPFQIDVLLLANKISFVPDIYYFYCFNETSLTKTFFNDKYIRYIALYNVLKLKLSNIDVDYLRCNRMIIGYMRSHILDIVSSNESISTKLLYIKNVCDDEVWNQLKYLYNAEYLSWYPRIFYNLIQAKQVKVLYVFSLFMMTAKKNYKLIYSK